MKNYFVSLIGASVLSAFCGSALAQDGKIQAADMVALFEKMSGQHPGHRKAHARGLCATGVFIPSPNDLFKGAPLLHNGELPVVMRFSLGGGDPDADERVAGVRGVGIQIKLPDGSIHHFTGNNFPVFAGKDPDTFHGFLSTMLPDESGKSDPAKTLAYAEEHPSVKAHMAWAQNAQAPASFANVEYYGLHTFYYESADKERTKFRWRLSPDLGIKNLTADEIMSKPSDFLADALAEQLQEGPVSFTLIASIGQEEDSTNDPSVQWPAVREKVELGAIRLTDSGGEQCKPLNFDPNVFSAGFSPSDDPVLRMRSAAYAISFGKRLSGQ
ncbi:catalase family peroxidase [Aliiglaciecola sp. CAU 1673]|uniref:catalase family peroxidase n=1 Tax=Aliiglaciecola sp. CAU 1673 TaxID=3032595 RepID=UPI0023DA2F10|nr:catalase family peroxidase [Aliiglaciecola sp. CAU 1673]MDF2176891.1 catalase family peroxidase [Aliiglaciecola sp. CAU 1673]